MSAPRLLETLRAESAMPLRLGRHRARMAASAAALGLPWSPWAFDRAVEIALSSAPRVGAVRLRVTLDAGGIFAVEVSPLPPAPPSLRLIFSRSSVRSDEVLCRHKTLPRGLYDEVRREAEASGAWDGVLFNERLEVCEVGRANLVALSGGILLTPPLWCGLLPGTVRAALLDAGLVREGVLRREDLDSADGLFVTNALLGVEPVTDVVGSGYAPRPGEVGSALRSLREALR